jgi:sulfite reductase alpha subunit-like flavoprotein
VNEELVTPVDVERELVDLVSRLDKAPGIIRDYHNLLRAARTEYKKAYAVAYASATGTQMDKKFSAELSTMELQNALDEAEISYKYVCDTQDALRTKLRALQSVGSLIRASMFGNQAGL